MPPLSRLPPLLRSARPAGPIAGSPGRGRPHPTPREWCPGVQNMSDMSYRRLGDSGLVVSAVGLGGNNFGRRIDLEATRAVVDAAFDAGINLIDTADIYGESEAFLGEVLRGRRDDVVLATKFGGDVNGANGADWGARTSRRYIRKAVERSLRRLRTDWIDLY